ncbi:hypothetical protein FO519_005539 [Halicephalobus sp. NKZ332]|nr:hypothetical protein FO519_005539 [Halicephalobus sp. NKZ332]
MFSRNLVFALIVLGSFLIANGAPVYWLDLEKQLLYSFDDPELIRFASHVEDRNQQPIFDISAIGKRVNEARYAAPPLSRVSKIRKLARMSPCVREEIDLDGLCRRIAGDSKLYTIFRTNAKPIPCPIPLPASFSYYFSSSGHTCRNDGMSIIDECSVPNRFRLGFVSCPQSPRSVTHDEAFECIADWNHYSTYYFAARIVGNPFNPALGEYRCFIVDQHTSRIGMSADSSCLELTALDQASVILNYSNAEQLKPNCSFPGHIRSFSDWISVTSGNTVKINKGKWKEISSSGVETSKAICLQEDGDIRVIRRTSGCNVGIFCLKIKKHSREVFSVSTVPMAVEDIELCKKLQSSDQAHFSFDMFIKDEYSEHCPAEGLLFSSKCNKPLLTVGCDFPSRMNLTDICSIKLPGDSQEVAITESLVCRSSFRIKNETFLIASSTRRFLCMVRLFYKS